MSDIFQKCYDFQYVKMAKATGFYPFFKALSSSNGSHVHFNGRSVIMASSNNYLGFTQDDRVKEKAFEAIHRFGTGCTGSRALNGNTEMHNYLEERLARFVGKEEALIFTTGFLTNLGTIGCLAGENDLIFSDAENHASIIEGCRLSKAKIIAYRHNDMSDLYEKLKKAPEEKGTFVVSDGVFSMTGDILNLPELAAVKREFKQVRLFLDDAHGLGVMGKRGEGTAGHFGLTDRVDLIMGTFSKSFASIGGFVAGPAEVIDYIRHNARSFIFSAAMPPAAVGTVLACLDILDAEPERVENLRKNAAYAVRRFERAGIAYIPSQTPIISVFVGDEMKAFQLVQELFEIGVFTTPVCFPAVPFGQAMLRTSYMATHSREDIDCVVDAFEKLASKYGILKDQIEVPKELEHKTETYSFAVA